MKKKIIILLSCIVLALAIIKVSSIYFLSDSKINEYVILPIKEQTGYDLSIGNIELSLFSGMNLIVEDLILIDPKIQTDVTYLLNSKYIELDVSILPFLMGDVIVNDIIIKKSILNHVLKEEKKALVKPISFFNQINEKNTQLIPSANIKIPNISLDEFELNVFDESLLLLVNIDSLRANADLLITPDSLFSNLNIQYKKVNVKNGLLVSENDFFNFKVVANIKNNTFNINQSNFEILNIFGDINSSIELNDQIKINGRVYSNKLELSKIVSNIDLPELKDFTSIQGDLSYDINFSYVNDDFKINYLFDMKNGKMKHKNLKIDLSTLNFNLSGNETQLDIRELFIELNKQRVKSNGYVKFKNELEYNISNILKLDLSKLIDFSEYLDSIKIENGLITGDIEFKSIKNEPMPAISGQIKLDDVQFDEQISLSGKNYINAQINLSENMINISNAKVINNLTNSSFSLRLNNYKNMLKEDLSKASLNLYLKSSIIDLSDFIKSDESQENSIQKVDSTKLDLAQFAMLYKLDVNADIDIKKFKFDIYSMSDIQSKITNINKALSFNINKMTFAKGLIKGDAKISYERLPLVVKSNYNIKEISFNPIINLFIDVENEFDGILDLAGSTYFTIQDSLDKKSIISNNDVLITDVIIRNNKILKKISKEIGVLEFDSLYAKEWKTNLSIKDEIVSMTNLYIYASDYKFKSDVATIGFDQKTKIPLNITLNKTKSSEYIDKSNKETKALLKLLKNKEGELTIDIDVSGKITDPKIKIDFSEAEKKAKKSLEKQLKNKIKKLF